MVLLEKDWYTIEEVAERLECKVDDVHHFIRAGKLKPVLWFENEPATIDRGKGERYSIALNGLWACLCSLRFPPGPGTEPVVYPIEADNPDKGFKEAFPVIMDSFEKALEYKKEREKECEKAGLKKEKYQCAISCHSETEFIVSDSIYRFYGDSKTAEKAILKTDFDRLKSEVNHTKKTFITPSQLRNDKRANERIENTNLVIIGALIEILKEETKFTSNAQIVDAITNRHTRVNGLGQRTLEGRFAEAKKAFFDATSD